MCVQSPHCSKPSSYHHMVLPNPLHHRVLTPMKLSLCCVRIRVRILHFTFQLVSHFEYQKDYSSLCESLGLDNKGVCRA